MSAADVLPLVSAPGGVACGGNNTLGRTCRHRRLLLTALAPLLLAIVSVSLRGEAPVAAQAYETLKATFTFQPTDLEPEDSLSSKLGNSTENIIQLEKMIVMESVAGRGVVESVNKQQATFKQARFDWETGGFYYRKVGAKYTIEAGVWSHGPSLTLLTVSW